MRLVAFLSIPLVLLLFFYLAVFLLNIGSDTQELDGAISAGMQEKGWEPCKSLTYNGDRGRCFEAVRNGLSSDCWQQYRALSGSGVMIDCYMGCAFFKSLKWFGTAMAFAVFLIIATANAIHLRMKKALGKQTLKDSAIAVLVLTACAYLLLGVVLYFIDGGSPFGMSCPLRIF